MDSLQRLDKTNKLQQSSTRYVSRKATKTIKKISIMNEVNLVNKLVSLIKATTENT